MCLASGPGLDVPVLLLDTDLHENAPEDRRITDTLYGGDQTYRFKQEIVLGIGGCASSRRSASTSAAIT
jgi:Glucan phosphorylase